MPDSGTKVVADNGTPCAANYSVPLTRTTISSPEALARLAPEWRELQAADPRSTPFQSPAWLLPWWASFGSGRLFTVAVRDGSTLAGLAPMFIHPWQARRQVTLLGNGLSDRLHFLLRPGYEAAALQQTFAALVAAQDEWDFCDFRDLHADDPLLNETAPGLSSSAEDLSPCLAIRLPATPDAFDASLASTVRRNLRRYHRDLAACGPPVFETLSTPDGFEAAFNALLEFHKARRGDDGGFTPAQEEFHRTSALRQLPNGATRLHVMRSGKTICALIYGLRHSDRYHACLGAFNPAFADARPGWLILDYAVKGAIAEGLTWFDFLRGDEEYKKLWRAEPYRTRRLFLWHE